MWAETHTHTYADGRERNADTTSVAFLLDKHMADDG